MTIPHIQTILNGSRDLLRKNDPIQFVAISTFDFTKNYCSKLKQFFRVVL